MPVYRMLNFPHNYPDTNMAAGNCRAKFDWGSFPNLAYAWIVQLFVIQSEFLNKFIRLHRSISRRKNNGCSENKKLDKPRKAQSVNKTSYTSNTSKSFINCSRLAHSLTIYLVLNPVIRFPFEAQPKSS